MLNNSLVGFVCAFWSVILHTLGVDVTVVWARKKENGRVLGPVSYSIHLQDSKGPSELFRLPSETLYTPLIL